MKLSCNVARDLLPLYHDGVCSDESRALVEEHLDGCPDCAGILKELQGEVELPHESPDDLAPLEQIRRNVKRGKKKAWLRGIAAALAVVMTAVGGWYGWWYANDYRYYQRFAQGREPVADQSADAHGNTTVLYEVDGDGHILGAVQDQPNVYMWSEGGYDFQVIVPRYPGDFEMLIVNKTMRPIPKNIVPGREIDTWLSFGREEYAYHVGVEVTTRTAVPGQAHLKTETATTYIMLDEDLNQIYPAYMDEAAIACQDAFYEEYHTQILDIIRAAQSQWPFLVEE